MNKQQKKIRRLARRQAEKQEKAEAQFLKEINLVMLRSKHDQTFLQQMDYPDFLRTDYWKTVRAFILNRDAFICQQCGWQPSHARHLDVHHTSYKHHGSEHLHLNDLTTLCRRCHDTHHT